MISQYIVFVSMVIVIIVSCWFVLTTQIEQIKEFCENRTGYYELSGLSINCSVGKNAMGKSNI